MDSLMPDRILTHSSDDMAIIDGAVQADDRDSDILSLRPERLDEYVGQAEVVETLKIAIEAAKLRSEPLEHVIFHGPPGLGKTTLAHIIANEMGGTLTVTSGPALEKGGDHSLKELGWHLAHAQYPLHALRGEVF